MSTRPVKRTTVEAELNRIVEAFIQSPIGVRSIWHGTNKLHMEAAVPGLSRGVLRGFWDDGKLHVILATADAEHAEAQAKAMNTRLRAQLPNVIDLVERHGTEFI